MLGIGGAGSGAAGGALAASGAAGTGSAVVGVGTLSAGATHVATILAAAVVTAGGAVELQHTLPPTPAHHHHQARAAAVAPASTPAARPSASTFSASDATATQTSIGIPPTQAQMAPAVRRVRAEHRLHRRQDEAVDLHDHGHAQAPAVVHGRDLGRDDDRWRRPERSRRRYDPAG